MESWRKVWREGIAPLLSAKSLTVLQRALAEDDHRLLQGATTSPAPLQSVQDWPVEAACALGFCGWQAEGLETVAEVEGFFSDARHRCDARMGEPEMCRWFLNWFDDTPREIMRRELLPEIDMELAKRNLASAKQSA